VDSFRVANTRPLNERGGDCSPSQVQGFDKMKAMSLDASKIIELYERHAQHWDQDRGRDLFEQPWLDRFLGFVPPGGAILDLGCGSAEAIARFFIDKEYQVTGADSSPSLIDICRHRFPKQHWIVADMRKFDLNARFEGIIAWDSLFHLCPEDQRRVFPLFTKHSAPNAALLFTSGPASGEAIGQYRGEPFTMAVWMLRSTANCWTRMDLP
jgi:SAM-dependent methyltransferase